MTTLNSSSSRRMSVNQKPPSRVLAHPHAARIVLQGLKEAKSRDPQEIARAIQAVSDREQQKQQRWTWRRVWQYVEHDDILIGLFGGLTGWLIAGAMLFAQWVVGVAVLSLGGS